MTLTARRLQAYGWLLLSTIAVGATVPIIKWGLSGTTPYRFLFYRFAVASLVAIPILYSYRKLILLKISTIFKMIGLELLGTTLALALFYIGLTQTTSLDASLIGSTGPVFMTIGALLFLREKIARREWFGLSLAAGMTAVLILISSFFIGDIAAGTFRGNSFIMLQNLVYVGYLLIAKRLYHTLPKILSTCVSVIVGLVSFAALSFYEVGNNFQVFRVVVTHELSLPSVWVIVIFAAVFTSFIGLTTYLKGQDLIEASEASIFCYLQPIVYIPLSIMLLNEHIYPLQLLSFGAVIVGVIVAEWKPSKTLRKAKKLHSHHKRL